MDSGAATPNINTHTERNVIAIPIQAVTTREKDKPEDESKETTKSVDKDEEVEEVVFVMQGDTSQMVHVTTGVQDNEYIQILTGLQPGQEVITGPYSIVSRKLKNGTRVERKEKEDKEKKDKAGDAAVEID